MDNDILTDESKQAKEYEMPKAKDEKKIMNYDEKKPTDLVISQSIVAQKLAEIDKRRNKEVLYEVGTTKERKAVTVSVLMNEEILKDKNISITGSPLTEFDKMVHDAIVSYFVAGNACFTIQDIYRLCNNPKIETIKKYTLEDYKNSIDRLRSRDIRIDATNQMQAFYPNVEKATYVSFLMPLEEIKIKMTNGELIDGYTFLKTPPVYEYSSDIKQIVNVKIQLLTEGRFRNSREVAVFNYYLVRRIEAMKSNKALYRKILYTSIFEEALEIDYSNLPKNLKEKHRKQILKRLEYYREYNYIRGFREYRDGRKIIGIELELFEDKK